MLARGGDRKQANTVLRPLARIIHPTQPPELLESGVKPLVNAASVEQMATRQVANDLTQFVSEDVSSSQLWFMLVDCAPAKKPGRAGAACL
jgi:hypothetical protein